MNTMKVAKLLHNPGAGDEGHSEEELIPVIEATGFECRYSSTKKNQWKDIENDVDLLIVGGGDGTIRKITKELLDRKMVEKSWPIVLLPLGTANNIAKTLGIAEDPKEIIARIPQASSVKYDVGILFNVKKAEFFLESLGFGIFPFLMMEMVKAGEEKIPTPDEKLTTALTLLHGIILSYEPRECSLIVDGVDHSGRYILAEVMNTRSIGPNLQLAPDADPSDGLFDIVVVPDSDKEKFADYVLSKLNNKNEDFHFQVIRGTKVNISWKGTHVHVDDEIIKMKESNEVVIEMKKGLLEFLV